MKPNKKRVGQYTKQEDYEKVQCLREQGEAVEDKENHLVFTREVDGKY